MSVAALLAIVVATSEARDPSTGIMVAVAAESLGSQASVRLLPTSRPEEVDAVAIERDLGATAVVALVWMDAARLHARLRLHVAGSDRTITRELVFDAADSRAERGRTLGLAAASMWPEIVRLTRAPSAPRAPPAAVPPPAGATEVRRPGAAASGAAPAPVVPAASERVAAAATPAPRVARVRVGVGAVGGAGFDGTAAALGGRAEGLLRLGPAWSLRLGIALQRATIVALPGHDYAASLAGGVEWWTVALSPARIVGFGLRADALLLRHDVRGTVLPGQPEQRTRYLPGADLLVQVLVRVGRRVELLTAGGVEAAPGRTDLRSGTTPVTVATLPALRFTTEVGLRVGF